MTGKEIAEALKRYEATHTGYSYSRLMELWGVIIDEGFAQNTQELMAHVGKMECAIADIVVKLAHFQAVWDRNYGRIREAMGDDNPRVESVDQVFKEIGQLEKQLYDDLRGVVMPVDEPKTVTDPLNSPCLACQGEGYVHEDAKGQIKCPVCYGSGTHRDERPEPQKL